MPEYQEDLRRASAREHPDSYSDRVHAAWDALGAIRSRIGCVHCTQAEITEAKEALDRLIEENAAKEGALRAAVSRLVLARASMRAALKAPGDRQLEAWLEAEHENGWIEEVRAALAREEGSGGG